MNIYVGNLSFDETETSLQEAFAVHGEVTTARIITDRETGRSRGFAASSHPDRPVVRVVRHNNLVRAHGAETTRIE